ncbi:hypothetical protein I4U23_006038 [Adineta vaga]|nr:hypothetical protein I4U23_006038 [Adineta vaga]
MSLQTTITIPFVRSVGIVFFICGVFGNILNTIIFYTSQTNSPSTFLLFTSSLFSLIYLIDGLLTRTLAVGFNIDPTRTNLIWCKTRTYLGQASSLISLTCTCYAWCDQFFLSSSKQKYRRLSELKRTKIAILCIILFWFIYNIPFYVLAQHVKNGNETFLCNVFANYEFNKYFSFVHQPIIAALIPVIFIIIIGILVYNNLSLLRIHHRREKAQRNLTSMIRYQTISIIIQTIPYGFFSMYLTLTSYQSKSLYQTEIESVILNIVSIFYYFSHSFSSFIYYISSSSYRQQAKYLCLKMNCFRVNRIVAIKPSNNT